MEARKCDVCGDVYTENLANKMTFQMPTEIQLSGARGPVTVNLQLLPYRAVPGETEKPVDLCSSCRRWVAELAARQLLMKATKGLWVTAQAPQQKEG